MFKWLWTAATLFIAYAATLPFDFDPDMSVVQGRLAEAIQRSGTDFNALSRSDLLQNVLLFVPFGVLGMATLARNRRLGAAILTMAAAGIVSVACELLQLLTIDRIASGWDVWANLAGAVVGAMAWIVASGAVQRAHKRTSWSMLSDPANRPLIAGVALVCVAGWAPFDVTLDVSTVWTKVKPLITGSSEGSGPLTDELLTALRFATLAFLLANRIGEQRTRWSADIVSVAACTLTAAGLEATQFLITSRSPTGRDLFAALTGVGLGVSLVPSLLRACRGDTLLTAATALAAVPFYLQPFTAASDYRPISTMPFLAYYQFTSLQTVSHVMELMLIYAPVGFAIVWTDDRRRMNRATLTVAAIASTLELSQGWIVGRFPDVTDVGVAILGGVIGAATARAGSAQPSSGIMAAANPQSSNR